MSDIFSYEPTSHGAALGHCRMKVYACLAPFCITTGDTGFRRVLPTRMLYKHYSMCPKGPNGLTFRACVLGTVAAMPAPFVTFLPFIGSYCPPVRLYLWTGSSSVCQLTGPDPPGFSEAPRERSFAREQDHNYARSNDDHYRDEIEDHPPLL